MKAESKKLAIDILKNTTPFKLGHLKYNDDGSRITIWCEIPTETKDPNFYHMEIVQLFAHPFSTYMRYNEESNKCELLIF